MKRAYRCHVRYSMIDSRENIKIIDYETMLCYTDGVAVEI